MLMVWFGLGNVV